MSKNTQDSQVQDDSDLKRYRTETPNLIYELRLTPFEIALYSHLKRTAGAGSDGRCFKSAETLAGETDMSEGMVSKAKKGLTRTDRPGLNGKALITVVKDDARPGRPRDVITIVDVWPENFLFFAQQRSPQRSPGDLQRSPQRSPGDPKNKTESSKKELSEERTEETLNVAPPPAASAAPEASGQQTLSALSEDLQSAPGGRGQGAALSGEGRPASSPEASESPRQPTTAIPPRRPKPADACPAPPGGAAPCPPPPADAAAPTDAASTAPTIPAGPALRLRQIAVDKVVGMTADEGSRRRFEQLYDLAEKAGLLLSWDQAAASTRKAVRKAEEAGEEIKAGAYFNRVAGSLLNERVPALVPQGTPKQRLAVRAAARASLDIAARDGPKGPALPSAAEG